MKKQLIKMDVEQFESATVQQLIDALNQVEDKTKEVYFTSCLGYHQILALKEKEGDGVEIIWVQE